MSTYIYSQGRIVLSTGGTASVTITDGVDTLLINTNGEGYVGGGVAHDAADSGNPVKIGARAVTTVTAASVANNDRTDLKADLNGRQFVTDDQVLAELVTLNANTNQLEGYLDGVETKLDSIITNTNVLTMINKSAALLDVATAVIPALGTLGGTARTEILASSSAAIKKIKIVEDVGAFLALYTGAATAEVLHCWLPLGGGEIDVSIPASTRVSIGHGKNSTISTATFMAFNFLG